MKIILIYIPLPEERKMQSFPSFPPLGIGYIGAYLRKFNYNVMVLDLTHESDKRIVEEVIEQKPDIIGFSTYYWNANKILEISEKINQLNKNIKIILGGPEPSYNPLKFINYNHIDGICMGEAEETFLKIVGRIVKSKSLDNIEGLYTSRNPSNIILFNNLNDLPSPYLEQIFDISKYHIFSFQTHRGCKYRCSYCQWQYKGKIRYFDISKIVSELKYLSEINNLIVLQCIDADFLADPKFADKLINKMIEKRIRFPQINFEVNYENFQYKIGEKLSKISDTTIIALGLESASPKVLSSVNKRIILDLFQKKVKEAKKSGLLVQINILLGLPFQTWETIENTLDYANNLDPDRIVINPLYLSNKRNIVGSENDFSRMSIEQLEDVRNKIIKKIKSGA